MKRLIVSIVCILLAASPASALNRVPWLQDMNPPSPWLNTYERDVRLGFGQLIFDMLGNTNGTYNNLTVSPVTGLYVSVGPSSVNTLGTVYQYLPEEVSAFGGFPEGVGSLALPADPTNVFLQGITASSGYTIGPLTPPASSGLSLDYLIEAQIQIVDTTSQSINIVQPTTSLVTVATANRDRDDTIIYQTKAGVAGTSGSQVAPVADTGWVPIAVVAVPNGTSTITSGMITSSPRFFGFAPLGTGGVIQINAGGTGCSYQCFVDLSTNQTISGNKSFNGVIGGNSGISLTGGGIYSPGSISTNGQFFGSTLSNSSGQLQLTAPGLNPVVTLAGGGLLDENSTGTAYAPFYAGTASINNLSTGGSISAPSIVSTGQLGLGTTGTNFVVTFSASGLQVENLAGNAFEPLVASGVTASSLSSTTGLSLNTGGSNNVSVFANNGLAVENAAGTAYTTLQAGTVSANNATVLGSVTVPSVLSQSLVSSAQLGLSAAGSNSIIGFANGGLFVENNAGTGFTSVTASAFTPSSDRSLKKNIKPIDNGLDDVMRLKPVSYDWRSTGKHDRGLIAQDVQSVLPELVSKTKLGTLALNYDGVIPELVRGMQQQQAEIKELKLEIAALKKR